MEANTFFGINKHKVLKEVSDIKKETSRAEKRKRDDYMRYQHPLQNKKLEVV